ncbi:zinc ribbon domain-containing protein [Luteitalea pratensis]|uniref:zinc ribbon domain-containing protein n=1 Tax=Luteitalea pratensis TaxID=1855912 RepID=UPI0012FFBDAD|nr:zinc ribbon domain-containing protein [Luteitalea pratensis]
MRKARRAAYLEATGGRAYGRVNDRDSRYLLPGFARCAHCGGGLKVVTRSHGRRRAAFYVCSSSYDRGKSVCPVSQLTPMEDVDTAVLEALRDDVLRPEVLTQAVELALDQLEAGPSRSRLSHSERQTDALSAECVRLAAAIAAGGPIASLVQLLQGRDGERAAVEADLEALRRHTPMAVDRRGLRAELLRDLEDWRGLLTGAIEAGRQVLRALLHGPLMCVPQAGKGEPCLKFEGAIALDRVLRGRSCLLASPVWASWNQLEQWLRAVDGLRLAA